MVSDLAADIYSFVISTDLACIDLINRLAHNGVFDRFMVYLTFAGNGGLIWLFLIVVLFAGGKPNLRKIALLALLALVASYLLNEGLKLLIHRPRPYEALTAVDLLVNPLGLSRSSFPSGHAVAAFTSATILSRKLPRLAVVFLSLAVLMAFSRVYVGMHYFSDVLAGAAFGVGFGCLVLKNEGRILNGAESLYRWFTRK